MSDENETAQSRAPVQAESAEPKVEAPSLSPWAGVHVQAWRSPSGTLHADPACAELKQRPEELVVVQASSVNLSEVPIDELHCLAAGTLAGDLRGAERVLSLRAKLEEWRKSIKAGGLPVELFSPYDRAFDGIDGALLGGAGAGVLKRRDELLSGLREKLAYGDCPELTIQVLAAWVARGRTPREYQARFRLFLASAFDDFARHGLVVFERPSDQLSQWLLDVSEGKAFSRATESLIEGEAYYFRRYNREASAEQIAAAWRSVASTWARMLQSNALAYEGEALILVDLSWCTRVEVHALLCSRAHASVPLRGAQWAVALMPAVIGLHFEADSNGKAGLVLHRGSSYYEFHDSERCASLLREILDLCGLGRAAKLVQAFKAASRPVSRRGIVDAEISPEIRWDEVPRFSNALGREGGARVLTPEQCLPAIRRASWAPNEQAVRKKSGERLYRLAPGHEGVLWDEGFWNSEPGRSEVEIAAVEALLRELGFTEMLESNAVSYTLERGSIVVYADPRPSGAIQFRAYKATKKRSSRSRRNAGYVSLPSPFFRLRDDGKSRLKERLEAAIDRYAAGLEASKR